MDAVGFVGSAGQDFVQENDFFVPLAHGDIAVRHGGLGVGQVGELVVVRCKQRAAANGIMQMLGDRPCD